MPRLPLVATALLLAALASSCDKPPAATPPPPPAVDRSTWPDEPSGPLWEALAFLPAAAHGEAGVVDLTGARRFHPPYGDAQYDERARQADVLFLKRLQLPATDVTGIIWADLRGDSRDSAQDFLLARVATPVERVREALKALDWQTTPGNAEIWRPARETAGPAPARILLRDGWFVRTFAGDKAIAAVLETWSAKAPSLRDAPNVREVVSGLPPLMPALVRFGRKDPPFPDTPLRIVAAAMATNSAAGEEFRVLAFSSPKGPEVMIASDPWKADLRRQDPATVVDRKGACLRSRWRQRKADKSTLAAVLQTQGEMKGLLLALESYRMEKGAYPRSLDTLREGEAPYIGGPAVDPWGNAIRYYVPGPEGEPFIIQSDGPDGTEKTADDIVMTR